MRLKILIPTEVLLDEEAKKVVAEAGNGSFCLEPGHIDFVAALVPGILFFEDGGDREIFLAVDEGILVKCGKHVLVSVKNAVRGGELGELQQIVEEKFRTLDEKEKAAQTVMSKIEAGFVRRFLEIQKRV